MRSDNLFLVNDREVELARLVGVLKKSKIPQNKPLVIEVPMNTSSKTLELLSSRLGSAGYEPFFKKPRHFEALTGVPDKRGIISTRTLKP